MMVNKALYSRRAWGSALGVSLLAAGLLLVAHLFSAQAGGGAGETTESRNPALPYYDVRLDKSDAARELRDNLRQRAGQTRRAVEDVQQRMAAGEDDLRARVPALKVDYSPDLRAPEVVGTDVLRGDFLTAPLAGAGAGRANAEAVRGFVRQNARLFGLSAKQSAQLTTEADYTNPDGNLSYVILAQRFNGLPVFRGEVAAMITREGEIARLINNLAPGLDENKLPTDAGSAESAVRAAALHVNRQTTDEDLQITAREGHKTTFANGQFAWPTVAEKMYFPTEPGVAVLAWRVLLWEQVAAYYVVVDAQTGALLWRKNIVADQTQTATYSIYNQESPAPFSPGPDNPNAGAQGAIIPRTTLTLVGNEAPNTFNNNGWLTNGATTTDGNNVEAGLDRDGANGVDPNGKPVSATRQFVYDYNPAPGSPPPGAEPTPSPGAPLSDFQRGVVTQLFYLNNVYHDRLYRYGFTEQARNFQGDNFGRGGTGNDRVSAEAQDSSGTNNANFGTPADGGRGRMQMYIFVPSTPDRDGSLDADVVWHEYTHGLSNRLVGNGSGLGLNQSRGMGEGWSDFYARALASGPDEDPNAIYTTGGWVTHQLRAAAPTGNYYFGIRHFPYAVRSNTGPNGRPHNPLTFADIDTTQANITDGAYTAPIPWPNSTFHAYGEVWCNMLLEVRARIIARLGREAGNDRMLQLVTDALKVTPTNPTFIAARDAILAADFAAFGGADADDIWSGFAVRGAGFGAATNGTSVTESFSLPTLIQTPAFTVSDAQGNNNGVPEPGELLTLSVPLQNPLNSLATGATVSVNGGAPVSYGDIAGLQTITRDIPFTVPSSETCGNLFTFNLSISSNRGPATASRRVQLGTPIISQTLDFDQLTAPALPTGWTSAVTGSGVNWVSTTTNPDTGTLSLFTSEPTTPGTAELTSADFAVTSANSYLSFRNRYDTEAGFDGGVLEISINGGAFQDIITAGGQFVSGGYNGVIGPTDSALSGRQGWSGNSNGYLTTAVVLPAAANGQNVKFKWRFATDTGTSGAGWNVDTVKFGNSYNCSPAVSGTLQFAGATFAANEGAGTATVTVTRAGAAPNSAASVSFATSDETALQRADYTLTTGRLDFAPGETAKSFAVSLVDDVYVEGSETLRVNLSAAAGSTINGGAATLTIADNDAGAPTANPSDGADYFVRLHYLDFLAREPDAAGQNYWTGQITQCGTNVTCINARRVGVSAAFFVESEFQESGGYVYRLYKAAFGQLPSYAAFMPDRAGVVGSATLEQGKQAFVAEFVTRPAFTARYPSSQTGAQFVDALLATVLSGSGVNLSSLRQTLIDDFAANGSRARVLRLVADVQAFRDAEYNRAFVLMQYFGYLRRDIDQGGYNFWLTLLNQQPSNAVGMACAFVTSQEYQQRFSPVFTHTNAECQ